jgi:hypothetical protein
MPPEGRLDARRRFVAHFAIRISPHAELLLGSRGDPLLAAATCGPSAVRSEVRHGIFSVRTLVCVLFLIRVRTCEERRCGLHFVNGTTNEHEGESGQRNLERSERE